MEFRVLKERQCIVDSHCKLCVGIILSFQVIKTCQIPRTNKYHKVQVTQKLTVGYVYQCRYPSSRLLHFLSKPLEYLNIDPDSINCQIIALIVSFIAS